MNVFLTLTSPLLGAWPLWLFLSVLVPSAVLAALTATDAGMQS